MTALKPLENRKVRGVYAQRYPLNPISSKPDSTEPAVDPHHIFPRSQIGNESWFVEIGALEGEDLAYVRVVIPHVTGLSREEHDDIEAHRAWIRLEDGIFNWYDRQVLELPKGGTRTEWVLLGPLNPQPGTAGTAKKKRRKFQGEAKRKRANYQVKVPADHEDGAGILDDLVEQCESKLMMTMGHEAPRPPYFTLTDVLADWLTSL
jgi:hypothetical protein